MPLDYESIIAGLVLMDVAATIGGNLVLWTKLGGFGERLTKLETEHNERSGQHHVTFTGRN
jgi:hypothetical protein